MACNLVYHADEKEQTEQVYPDYLPDMDAKYDSEPPTDGHYIRRFTGGIQRQA